MTYAFHTPDKLCFILDLMNGGDLHYHLSQHGVFNEQEMRFYAAEVILGTVSLKGNISFIYFRFIIKCSNALTLILSYFVCDCHEIKEKLKIGNSIS